jgi:hypothetical protein
MRVKKVEKVKKRMELMKKKVRMESIGEEDIVDGKKSMIIGIIWKIIMTLNIKEIEIEVEEESERSEKKYEKEEMMMW